MTLSSTLTTSVLKTLTASILFIGLSHAAYADTSAANRLIEQYHVKVKEVLSGSQDATKVRNQIKTELAAIVDFPAFAELALKKYYSSMNKKDKELYTDAFRSLIEATYVKRIKPGGGHELIFRDEPEIRDGKVMVFTTVVKGDNEVDIDYLLHKVTEDSWKIYDIWIDEVSMARNYRSQFYKIYKEHGLRGPKGLLTHMTQRQREEAK